MIVDLSFFFSSAEGWRCFCSPPARSSPSSTTSSLLDQTDEQEAFAFVWREPYVLPWGAAGPLKPKPPAAAPTTTSTYGSSYGSSYGSTAAKPASPPPETEPPGSFLLLEAGVKGSFAQLLSRDVFLGVFSVRVKLIRRTLPSWAG